MSRKDESVVLGIEVVMPSGEVFPIVRTSERNEPVLNYKICYDRTVPSPQKSLK